MVHDFAPAYFRMQTKRFFQAFQSRNDVRSGPNCSVTTYISTKPTYPQNTSIGFSRTYPINSDLSDGQHYRHFENVESG